MDQVAALPIAPGQRLCISSLSNYLSDLQSCCGATAACFAPPANVPVQVHVENLAAHPAVRVVIEEARRMDAEDVMNTLRDSIRSGRTGTFYPHLEGVSSSVFRPPPHGARRVEATATRREREAEHEYDAPHLFSPIAFEPGQPRKDGPLPSVAAIVAGMPFASTLAPVHQARRITDDYFSATRSRFGSVSVPSPWSSYADNDRRQHGQENARAATAPTARAAHPSFIEISRNQEFAHNRFEAPPVKSPGAARLSPVDRPGTPEALLLPPSRMTLASLTNS